MNCPRCESLSLHEIDRDGITLDRCERCRGIWLDRGELEKLLARGKDDSERRSRDVPANGHDRFAGHDDDDDDRRRRRGDDDDDDDRRGTRRRSWWEIFD